MSRTDYIDQNGERLYIGKGIGKPPCWFTKRHGHRVKSKALPVRATWEEAQEDLDRWAASKGFLAHTSGGVVLVLRVEE
jgi:hypothetical protein